MILFAIQARLPLSLAAPHHHCFGDVFHYDVGHDCGTAIGGIKYALAIVSCNSCFILTYPLCSLGESDILSNLFV